MMAHKMHVRNFKMKTVELAVEAMLIDENSRNGHSIQVTSN